MQTLTVGFVGLGVMGAPMAANLIRAGFAVSVFSRTPQHSHALLELGAAGCSTLAELAGRSHVVITMVRDTADVEEVLFQMDGLAESLKPESIVIDMSTISPSATVVFARRLRDRSIFMLDAPVSGGELGARNASLSIMVGGEEIAFERCLPIFRSLGTNVIHVGANGRGQMTKLVNQIVTSLNLLATIEAIRVVEAAGLNVEDTLNVIGGGAGASWMLSHLGPKIASHDFAPGFRIRLQDKDLQLAAAFASELGLATPGLDLVSSLFQQAVERGLGNEGNHGLYRLWES